MPLVHTPRPGTPPTPDTAFPSMGPKWTARRFVIDPPDDERGLDVGDYGFPPCVCICMYAVFTGHVHVCKKSLSGEIAPGCPVRRATSAAEAAQDNGDGGMEARQLSACQPDKMYAWLATPGCQQFSHARSQSVSCQR